MNYHIPTDEQIDTALKKILKKTNLIPSQKKLKQFVSKELNKRKKKYGVSEQRIRLIAANSDYVKLEIHSRDGDPKKILNKCPVCEGLLKKVKNLTIYGGEVTIEYSCPICGYWTGKKKRVPTRYVFHLKKKNI